MKAIEKDRSHRYETAAALANDVKRYLAGEPMSQPVHQVLPTVSASLRLRYRVAVMTAALVTLALVAGTVASSLGLMQAWRMQGHLEVAQKDSSSANSWPQKLRGNKPK